MKTYHAPLLRIAPLALAAALWSAPPAHALVNGTDTSSFSAVGAVGGATGVLIADNWVLTAAHVANGIGASTISFESLLGSSLIDGVYTFTSDAFPNHDIALLHLATSIDADTPILNDKVIKASQASSLGPLTMASAQNQVPNGMGTTTAATAKSSYTDSSSGTTYTVNWLITNGSAYVEGGDSGSALFKGAVSDSGGSLLLGVASASLTDAFGNPESAFVQVASYKTWIDSTMASSGQQARWLSSPVPEPSTVSLFAVAGLLALGHRGARALRRAPG